MAKLTIHGPIKYAKRMEKHLSKEHPKTKGKMTVRDGVAKGKGMGRSH